MAPQLHRRSGRRPLGCAALVAAACWAAPALNFVPWTSSAAPARQATLAGQPQWRPAASEGRQQPLSIRPTALGSRRPLQSGADEAAPAARGGGRRWLAAAALSLAVLACGAGPAAARTAAATMPVWAVLPLDKVYHTLAYLPALYFVPLVFLPRWSVTKRLGKSHLPFFILGAVYIYCAAVAIHFNPDVAPFLKDLCSGQASLAKWNALLASDTPLGTKSLYVWAGLKISNMFIGRHIYLDSIKSRTFALHSMLAAFCINGSVGYMLHVMTKFVNGTYRLGISECVDEEDPLPYQQ